MHFPDRDGQRIVARTVVSLSADGIKLDSEKPEVHLVVEGMIEQGGGAFDEFRMRFQLPAPKKGEPLVLALDRPLRPMEVFSVRLKVKDELGGGEAWLTRGFQVPKEPTFEPMPAAAQTGELVPVAAAAGADSLLLLPATDDIVMGLWRASAIVTGERIQKVVFLVDGKAQLTTSRSPFTAEVRLEKYPTEQTVRAEGYDTQGKLVAADEVIINQPKGAFNVRVVSPGKGTKVTGKTALARAEVVVPDGRKVKSIDFKVNDDVIGSLTVPPWEMQVPVPDGDLVYLTVQATLDDGTKAEGRALHAGAGQHVAGGRQPGRDVRDGDGQLGQPGARPEAGGFPDSGGRQAAGDREVRAGAEPAADGRHPGRPPSGSMEGSLVDAEKAASGFLRSVMKPKDKAFLVSFALRSRLDMPPTDDVGAMVQAIEGLKAAGETALPRRPGAQPLLLPRRAGTAGDDPALRRRRQQEFHLPSRTPWSTPRVAASPSTPSASTSRCSTPASRPSSESSPPPPAEKSSSPIIPRSCRDLQADRDRAAQPLPGGLQLHQRQRCARLPGGGGEVQEERRQDAGGPGVLPVRGGAEGNPVDSRYDGVMFGPRTPVTSILLVAIAAVFALETFRGGSTNPQVLLALGADLSAARAAGRVLAAGDQPLPAHRRPPSGAQRLGALPDRRPLRASPGLRQAAGGLLRGGHRGLDRQQPLHPVALGGASGAIFGVMGALIAFLAKRRENLTPQAKSLLMQLVLWAGINVFLGFTTPGIDNAAHLGGCAAGLAIGFFLKERPRYVSAPLCRDCDGPP